METLVACAPVYGTKSIVPYLEDLWDYLRDEVLNFKKPFFFFFSFESNFFPFIYIFR